MRPSPHLSWRELACKDARGTAYPEEWRMTRLPPLVAVFEAIRAECGCLPIMVNSAFRTPEHNRRIGGARHSQHVQGRALDLSPPSGWTVDRFYELIREYAWRLPDLKGIGRYGTFVHVDVRPTARLVVWRGAGVKDGTVA